MGRKSKKVVELLSDGLTPGEIAHELQEKFEAIMATLLEMVGKGNLRRSDILYSIPSQKRIAILEVKNSLPGGDHGVPEEWVLMVLRQSANAALWTSEDAMRGDIHLVLDFSESRVALGDMYEELRDIELIFHDYVVKKLKEEFGHTQWWEKTGWWADGVPTEIREACNAEREHDSEKLDPYCYAYFIDHFEIISKRWPLFESSLLQIYPGQTKKSLEADFRKLNQIRNKVMHPVRGVDPTEADFELVRAVRKKITSLVGTR